MTNFKKWHISDSKNFKELMQKYSVCSLSGKVAASRLENISEKELFSREDTVFSPFDLKDMDRAADKINEALDLGTKMVVYGDYDTDGVCATVILFSYLQAMGAEVGFYIPSRETEGYGLNCDAIDALSAQGYELIITVDNGVAAADEIEYAKSLGMEVVVTDHHQPQQTLPDCIVVDPHREDCNSRFKDICGAFVAFKLVAALDGGDYSGAFEQYAELVAIATVADVVPLVSENRTIVRLALEKIADTDNLGLRALINASLGEDTVIDSNALTYGIVPRINAAGRMGDAVRAAELLLCEDEDEAEEKCAEICAENNKRKQIEADILLEIEDIFKNNPDIVSDRVIVVCGKNWHHGVLGIVASKLVEKTGKPALVLSSDGETATGSGRSVEGFSLFEAMLASNSLYDRFGGHALAVGVTLKCDKVEILRHRVNDYAAEKFLYMPQNYLSADAVISAEEISLAAVKELSMFEPFGKSNPAPAFAIMGATVQKIASIGNGKHTRLSLFDGKNSFTALVFGTSADGLKYYQGKRADLIVKLKINHYAGEDSVTIQALDIRPSDINDELFFKEKGLFEMALRQEELTAKQAAYLMPTREEAAAVYRYVKALGSFERSEDILWWILDRKINRAKLSVIIEAFLQNGILTYKNGTISPSQPSEKKDLFNCDILNFVSGYMHS